MKPISWRGFYAIIDPEHCAGRDPIEVAGEIVEGGCAVLQLRDKRGDDAATLSLARVLREVTKDRVPFVVNDRVDLALLCDADGVHLGQDDMSIEDARKLVGTLCIGISTHDRAQAIAAAAAGADLIGFGPVFATATKENPDPVVGLSLLSEVASAVEIPVVAIGGVDVNRSASAYAAGATLCAAISAVTRAESPREAARAMQQAHQEVVGSRA